MKTTYPSEELQHRFHGLVFGILIKGYDWNYAHLAGQTEELLQRENLVISETAFKFDILLIRSNILVKWVFN